MQKSTFFPLKTEFKAKKLFPRNRGTTSRTMTSYTGITLVCLFCFFSLLCQTLGLHFDPHKTCFGVDSHKAWVSVTDFSNKLLYCFVLESLCTETKKLTSVLITSVIDNTMNIYRYKTIEANGNTSVIPTTSKSFSLYWDFH